MEKFLRVPGVKQSVQSAWHDFCTGASDQLEGDWYKSLSRRKSFSELDMSLYIYPTA